MLKKRKTYTKEFKLEAVRLMNSVDRPASSIAMGLGVRRNQLYKWQEELNAKGESAFGGSGRPKGAPSDELKRLKQENERLREENEILKKAAQYFARELK